MVHTLDRWARNTRIALESVGTLAKNNVALVSMTENIDHSTAQSRLLKTMLAGFAEYFSDSLSTHIKKGWESEPRMADIWAESHLGICLVGKVQKEDVYSPVMPSIRADCI